MPDIQSRIRDNPKFQKFISSRNRYSIIMTVLGSLAYYGFILLVAFDKPFLAQKISEGSVTSIGIPIGVGVIIITIILTWLYVMRANSEFDETNAEIIKEAQR